MGSSLRLFVAWKTGLTALLVMVPLFLYEQLPHYNKFSRHYTRLIHPIPRPLFHWDGEHYMSLVLKGYAGTQGEPHAFYPLLPYLVRGVSFVVQSPMWSAIIVTTIAAAAFIVVYVKHFEDRGLPAAILVLCYPVAFYLGVVYTEALFLALLFGFLHLRKRGHWGALLCAFALPLCRGQGLLVGATMIGVAGLEVILERGFDHAKLKRAGLETAAFGLGFAATLAIFDATTGSPWTHFAAQKLFIFNNSVANVFDVAQTWDFITRVPVEMFTFVNAWFDKIFVVVALALLVFVRRTGDLTRSCLALSLTLVPILMGEGGSFARFSLLPFALLAPEISDALRRSKTAWVGVLAVSAIAQSYLAGRFAMNLWVS